MTSSKTNLLDASGRGQVGGFRVPYPSRMYAYTEEEIETVVAVMRSEKTLTQGEHQAKFESDFAQYVGAAQAFAVSSGSAALRLAANLCGLGKGDEVIVPAYTFCGTAVPLGASGATLVWADMDPSSRTICVEDIARKITPRTKAIAAVHLLGMPCDMDAIMDLAGRHGIKVIEDCAQAPGARYKGRRVGSIGDFGCFSFNGAKNMTTLGEGGMIAVKNEADAAHVPGLRHNGVRAYHAERARYWVPAMSNVDLDLEGEWPLKYCLTEAQCALGSALLKRMDGVNETLRSQYASLSAQLKSCESLHIQSMLPEREHAAHAFVVSFSPESEIRRDEFMDVMTKKYGIRLIVQYLPLYKYPLFQKMGFGHADCPNLERYWPSSFSYPWWCGMPNETLEYMAESTRASIEEVRPVAAKAGDERSESAKP